MGFIALIAYLFWAVFGLIFWFPLLTRITASFCVSLSYGMLVNNAEGVKKSKESVYHAISFYATGFKTIHSTLFETNKPKTIANDDFRFHSFLGQIIWTLIFWGTIFIPFFSDNIRNFYITNGTSSSELIEKAENSLAISDTTSAIEYYSYAIEKDKLNTMLYNKRGKLYYNIKNYGNAVQDFTSVMKLDTSYQRNSEFTRLIGWQLIELEKYYDAIEYFDMAIKYKPQYASAYFNRGVCYANVDMPELALKDFDKTIQIDSNFSAAYLNKGLVMHDIKKTNEACLLFDKAIKLGNNESIKYKRKYCPQ